MIDSIIGHSAAAAGPDVYGLYLINIVLGALSSRSAWSPPY